MKHMDKKIEEAYKILDGKELNEKEALALLRTDAPFRMDLYSLADKVRRKFCGSEFEACEITNAKSGRCSEDCSFCAQSSHHSTKAAVYSLKTPDEIVESAKVAKRHGSQKFCIVVSGKGYKHPNREFMKILAAVRAVREDTGLEVHCSPGILSRETAGMLSESGVAVINHNIETAPSFFPEICTTHRAEDRIETVRLVKEAGMKICCGGIIGLGESLEQRIEFASTLKRLDVDAIPINIHQKIEGTRGRAAPISVDEILSFVAVIRLLNPAKIIKIAAGRNTVLSDYQGLAFNAGANGMLVGGYLTISGREIEKDWALMESLGVR